MCCCGCNLGITMIIVLSDAYSSKANSAYKSGDVQEYKRNSKSATICLVGSVLRSHRYGWSLLSLGVLYSNDIEDAFMEGYNEAAGVSDDYDTMISWVIPVMKSTTPTIFSADDSEDTEDAVTVAPLDVTAGDAFDSGDITVRYPVAFR